MDKQQEIIESTGTLDVGVLVRTPRPPRLQFEGAFYHVYTRGNRRERTYLDNKDYREFEDTLLDATSRSGVNLYAWCLMPNHFHLLVETPHGNLALFMQRLLTSYARYFNRRYKLVGHVFQGRYGSKLCNREEHLLELVRYIHLNPYRVKSRRWKVPAEGWPWSSHRYYIHGKEPQVVAPHIHSVLRRFSAEIQEARKGYEKFVGDGLENGDWQNFYQLKDGKFLGNDKFVDELRGPSRVLEPETQSKLSLQQLVDIAAHYFGVSIPEMTSKARHLRVSRARLAVVHVGRRLFGYTSGELAKTLVKDPSAVSHMIRALTMASEDTELKGFVDHVSKVAV